MFHNRKEPPTTETWTVIIVMKLIKYILCEKKQCLIASAHLSASPLLLTTVDHQVLVI